METKVFSLKKKRIIIPTKRTEIWGKKKKQEKSYKEMEQIERRRNWKYLASYQGWKLQMGKAPAKAMGLCWFTTANTVLRDVMYSNLIKSALTLKLAIEQLPLKCLLH